MNKFKERIDFDKNIENIKNYIDILEDNVEFNYCNVSDNFEIEVLIKTRNMKIREKIYRWNLENQVNYGIILP